eukprot:PITA_03278
MSKIIQNKPSSFSNAIKHQVWKDDMTEEYDSIMKNDVWEVVPRPQDKTIVTSKWLYEIKHAADGSTEKYTTIHSIIALVASQGWNLHQMDVKTVFLHGSIKEEVYVEQPEGFEIYDRKSHVCGLKKALYGLKQAPRAWCPTLSTLILKCKRELASEFEMKDLGLMHYFLGLEVWQKPGETFLPQGKYVVNILERFSMVGCKPVTTLMELDFKKLSGSAARPVLRNTTEYRKLVKALMFLVNSHPDI